MYRIGIDVGGTHTDGVVIKDCSIFSKAKVITNHNNLESSITDLLEKLTSQINKEKISKITLSTTLTTNIILENKLPDTGLIISGGPGINLNNFKKGNFSYLLSGAIDHRGRVIKQLNIKEVEPIIDELIMNNIETVAVCSKFSVRNPLHENLIKERLETKFLNVTVGHFLSGSLNFPRRINSAYLNAATFKKNKNFIDNILNFLKKYDFNCPVYILKADGGTILTNEALLKPVETILSGSAAGVIGTMSMLNIDEESAALIDIGGTSSDFSIFYNGYPLFEPEGIKIGDEPTLVRAIFSQSIGIGGDSFIKVENNTVKIGPERKGAAIAFGGQYLTPTDVVFYYEKINNSNMDRVKLELDKLAKKLNVSILEVCEIILKKFATTIKNFLDNILLGLNNKPLYTIKGLIGYKDIKINKIYLIGAPAKNFYNFLKKYLNFDIEVVPNYDIVNAIGSAVSKTTKAITLFADTSVQSLSISELGVYNKISHSFTVEDCHKILKEYFSENEYEITEEMYFNIISNFHNIGKTYRLKAQVKPGAEIFIGSKLI